MNKDSKHFNGSLNEGRPRAAPKYGGCTPSPPVPHHSIIPSFPPFHHIPPIPSYTISNKAVPVSASQSGHRH